MEAAAETQPGRARPDHLGAARGPMPVALRLAWGIEILAVGMGLFLAVLAGVEGGGGALAGGLLASFPFVMLAVIELTKIPIVQAIFATGGWFWRLLGGAMLLVVTLATFENFVFGFERAFHQRMAEVSRLARERGNAEAELRRLEARVVEANERLAAVRAAEAALRADREAAREQARRDIEDARQIVAADALAADRERLREERLALIRQRDAEIAANQRACRAPDSGVACNPTGIARNYAARLAALDQQEARLREDLMRRQNLAIEQQGEARRARAEEIQALEARMAGASRDTQAARAALAHAQEQRDAAFRALGAAEFALAEALARSQMHRLARVLAGSDAPEAVEGVLKLFVVSLAAIVALIGSLIAALHFASLRHPARPPGAAAAPAPGRPPASRLANAIRAFLVHRRKRRVRTVTQRVEVPVERIKLVFLPLDATEQQVARARQEAMAPAR